MNKKPKVDLLEKEEFMQKYVLNRAKGHTGGLEGWRAVTEAEEAYNKIKELCRELY